MSDEVANCAQIPCVESSMFQNLSSRVKALLTIAVVLAAFIGSIVALVIADRAKPRSLYNGPAACPLVGTEDLLRLGNPPGSRSLLDEGLEDDVERNWTEESTTRRRTTRKVDRSQKVGQRCTWVWIPAIRSEAGERTSLVVAVLNKSSVRPSWASAPTLARSAEPIEGFTTTDRPSSAWRWTDLPTSSGPTIMHCTIRQIVGLRYLEITWGTNDTYASCDGTVALAVNAADRLIEADRAGTTPS